MEIQDGLYFHQASMNTSHRSPGQKRNIVMIKYSVLSVKSSTTRGREALLSRTGNENIDFARNWMTNVFVRIPNVLKAWEIWFGLVSVGLFYYLRGGHTNSLATILNDPLKAEIVLEKEDLMTQNLNKRFEELIKQRQNQNAQNYRY
jgi:hypothetical protein